MQALVITMVTGQTRFLIWESFSLDQAWLSCYSQARMFLASGKRFKIFKIKQEPLICLKNVGLFFNKKLESKKFYILKILWHFVILRKRLPTLNLHISSISFFD